MSWSVPRLWPDSTVVVIGSGPSLTAEQVEYCVGRAKIIATCESWVLVPEAERPNAIHHACEFDELHRDPDPYASTFMHKITLVPNAAHSGVHLLRHSGHTGFDPDPRHVRTGGNSGYQAMCIAIHLGAKKIVLLGMDGKPAGSRLHWHREYAYASRQPKQDTFKEWVRAFNTWPKSWAEVVNATPDSAIKAFPLVSLEEALA